MQHILERINNASLKFLAPLSLDETYEIIVKEAMKLVAAEYGYIFLQQKGSLKMVYSSSSLLPPFIPRKRGFTYKTFKSGKPAVLNTKKLAKSHPEILPLGFKSTIFIPLSYRNRAIGVLSVHTMHNKSFATNELSTLKLFGSLASLAIRKNQLYAETKKALDVRDHFISVAAHELRTPLTAINGYIQLLNSRLGKTTSSEGRWVQALTLESSRFTHLVAELLDINRLKTGQLQFSLQEIHLSEILQQTINRFKKYHPEKVVVVRNSLIDGEDLIVADVSKMGQVISNILHNALKFAPQDSPIKVVLIKKQQSVCIKIVDEGKGLAKEDIPKVLEGFYKPEENTHQGMGVGLLFAKYVVDYHNGSIAIHSILGKGTTVELCLPRVRYKKR